jgi:hypothetical protein
VFFNASSSPGTYTNFAQVRSVSRSPSLEPFLGYFADSNIASSSVLVIGTAGEVGGGAVTAIEPSLATPPEETTVLLVASSTTSSVIERTPRPSHPEVKRGEDGKPVFFFDIPGGGNAISSVPVSSSGLASVFTALRRPWSREFDFLVFIAIVVLVYLTQDSFPRYRAILRSFFSL